MINSPTIFKENYFDQPIIWSKQDDEEYPYASVFKGISLRVRLNDFPDQPLYTLIVSGEETANFDDWPKTWRRQGNPNIDPLAHDIKEGILSGFIGSGTVVTGEVSFKAMLRIDGHLSGRINSSSGTLIVGTEGRVDANIEVAVAVIHGTINGDIMATKRLELGRAAKVNGNISTPSLVLEEGAIFEGTCKMIQISTDKQRRVDNSSERTTEETLPVDRRLLEGSFQEMNKQA